MEGVLGIDGVPVFDAVPDIDGVNDGVPVREGVTEGVPDLDGVPVREGVTEGVPVIEGVAVDDEVELDVFIPDALELPETEMELFDDKEAELLRVFELLALCRREPETTGLLVAIETLCNTVLVYKSEEVDNLLGELVTELLPEPENEASTVSVTIELILGFTLGDTDCVDD